MVEPGNFEAKNRKLNIDSQANRLFEHHQFVDIKFVSRNTVKDL